jgi:patatin-like phospholipase/acyl hydrolase
MAFKILSLDGGGTWALLEAMALEAIYGDLPGRQILDQFDLVTGN